MSHPEGYKYFQVDMHILIFHVSKLGHALACHGHWDIAIIEARDENLIVLLIMLGFYVPPTIIRRRDLGFKSHTKYHGEVRDRTHDHFLTR